MNTLLQDAIRDSLASDVLGALDFTESVYRGLERDTSTAKRLGMDDETFARVQAEAKIAYEALCRLRILTDWRRNPEKVTT